MVGVAVVLVPPLAIGRVSVTFVVRLILPANIVLVTVPVSPFVTTVPVVAGSVIVVVPAVAVGCNVTVPDVAPGS